MTEPKEDDTDSQSQDTGVVIYVRRKPGRPKKYQTDDERRLAKNGKMRVYYEKNWQKKLIQQQAYRDQNVEKIRTQARERYHRKKAQELTMLE